MKHLFNEEISENDISVLHFSFLKKVFPFLWNEIRKNDNRDLIIDSIDGFKTNAFLIQYKLTHHLSTGSNIQNDISYHLEWFNQVQAKIESVEMKARICAFQIS